MLKNFIKAARLRTLPLSVSGIIVGAFLGDERYQKIEGSGLSKEMYEKITHCFVSEPFSFSEFFANPILWLAILTTIGFQVLSNFANDYGDGIKGTDDNREGEKRLVASGDISPKQMKNAMVITAIITIILALLLIYVSFGKENFLYSVIFFVLGIVSIISAIKYTVGKSAYGYSGFGDIFVFLFFGLLAVVGTYFLYTKSLSLYIFLPAISVGLLSTAVLNLNNMRDRVNDGKVGKNTLVVKYGASWAKKYHYFLIGFSFLSALYFVIDIHTISMGYVNINRFLFVLAYIPLIKHLLFVRKNTVEANYDGELKKVALSTFLFAILFGIGQIL